MELLVLKVAIILAVGFLGGKVLERLKLPSVSGYLLFGLLLGPSLGMVIEGFNGVITISDQADLKFISEIALSFIAFSIGSEFNLKKLKKDGKKITTIANYEVLGVLTIVFLLLFFIPKPEPIMFGYNPFSKGNIAFGLILAGMSVATAPAATLMVVREYRAHGPLTKTFLPVVALDDIHGVMAFGFLLSIAKVLVSNETNLLISLLMPFIEIFGSLLLGLLVGIILKKLSDKLKKKSDFQIISVLAVFLIMGIIMVINERFSASYISLSTLLANMMAGAVITNKSKKKEEIFDSLNNFTAPFYIIFFTIAGAALDLSILKTSGLITLVAIMFIIARGTGKYIGAYIGATITKTSKEVRKYIGFTLLPQGGISLGLLVIVSKQMTNFYPVIQTVIMFSILVYETTGPIFAKYAISKSGEINGLDRIDLITNVS